VRSAIAVRPVGIAAPAEKLSTGTSGSAQVDVKTGFVGSLTAAPAGLVPAQISSFTLSKDGPDFESGTPETSTRTGAADLTVPAGTKLARFATFDADYPEGTDVDIFVYRKGAGGALALAGQSAGGTAEESIDLVTPGDYRVFVHLFDVTSGSTATIRHHFWAVGAATGNLTVTPASQPATNAGPATVTSSWSGLTAGTRYLGGIVYGDGTKSVGFTLLRVDA